MKKEMSAFVNSLSIRKMVKNAKSVKKLIKIA